ncbi:MAG: hypothetical protein K2O27_05545 [Candidatus Amulumruptor sp.]|nr:hypothetical protein [Candidatus Amulumruptor sp.]
MANGITLFLLMGMWMPVSLMHGMKSTLCWLIRGSIAIISIMLPLQTFAQLDWRIEAGGMMSKHYGVSGEFYDEFGEPGKKTDFEAFGALLLRISLSSNIPLSLETGLGYRNKLVLSQEKGFKFEPSLLDETISWTSNPMYGKVMDYRGNFIEIPVKAIYSFNINEKNGFDLGLGPYVSMVTERGLGDPVSVGLNASVAYKYRRLSVGVAWQNPLFLNGPRDYYKNSCMLTLGLTLGKPSSEALGNFANTLGAVGSALGEVSQSYASSSTVSNSYTVSSDTSDDSSYSQPSNKKNGVTGQKNSIAEQQAFNRD